MTPSYVAFTLAALGACVAAPEDVPTGELSQSVGATTANEILTRNTARVAGCLATKISATFAVTSRACDVQIGDDLTFFLVDRFDPVKPKARVVEIIGRPGTSAWTCQENDCIDSSGLFGDVALLRLANTPDGKDGLNVGHATMMWRYPGEDVPGFEVTPGEDFNIEHNPLVIAIPDTLDSVSDGGGAFETTEDNSGQNDYGGGFWVGNRVLGTLWGSGWDLADGNWARYASVPRHLDWILQKISFTWRGVQVQNNTVYDGTAIETFGTTERVCQYACENTQSCEAYNYNPTAQSCQLVTTVSGRHTTAGRHAALHYGTGTGYANDIAAYVRSDGWNSVVHKTNAGGLHEFYRNPNSAWFVGSLPTFAFHPPAGKLSAYRRADGVNAVLYRSTGGRIIEVALGDTGWKTSDLTAWGGTAMDGVFATGDPVGYVRGDGISAVVFRGKDSHVHELRLGSAGWIATDLIKATGFKDSIANDVTAFASANGTSNVVFRSTANNVVRLLKPMGQAWGTERPNTIATEANGHNGGPALPAGRTYGLTHRNGTVSIVYRTAASRLVELRLESGFWRWEDLSSPNTVHSGDPTAYVRTDAVDSILSVSYDEHLREITRSPLQHWNLSLQYSALYVKKDPAVFVRNDGTNSIVYGLPSNWVGEMAMAVGDGWSSNNLSLATGEQP